MRNEEWDGAANEAEKAIVASVVLSLNSKPRAPRTIGLETRWSFSTVERVTVSDILNSTIETCDPCVAPIEN